MESGKDRNTKRRKEKNRASKLVLKFDETKRTEYLTGFRKRRKERQERAKQEQAKLIKEARASLKKKEREKKKKKLEKIMASFQDSINKDEDGLSVLEKEKEVFESDETTVTVAALDFT